MSSGDLSLNLNQAFGVTNLWRGQRRLLSTRRKVVLFLGALGCGKSDVGALKAIQLATINQGWSGWVVAQTVAVHKQNIHQHALRYLDAFSERMGWELDLKSKRTGSNDNLTIRYRGGGSQYYVGELFANRNRGPSLAYGIIDEGTKLSDWEQTVEAIKGRVRGDAPLKQIVMCSNPDHGAVGAVKHVVERCERGDPDYDLILAPTWENQVLGDDYAMGLMKGMSRARAAAMIAGLLLRSQASVWPEFQRARHVLSWDPVTDGVKSWFAGSGPIALPWAIGCDWGMRPALVIAQRVAVMPDGRMVHPDLARAGGRQAVIFIDEDVTNYGGNHKTKDGFRRRIHHWTETFRCPPSHAASDRADREMNRWLADECQSWPTERWYAVSQEDQLVGPGIERVREMLDPIEGQPGWYASDRLTRLPGSQERGIIAAMEGYRWRMRGGDFISEPLQDNVYEHVVDAQRYMCRQLFGGAGATFSLS